jgi:type I restriction enzyme M protein
MSVRTTVKSIQDIMRQDSGVDGDAQRISQLCWMFFLKIIDDQDQELELLSTGYRSPIPPPLQWRTWAADPEGITGDELLAFVNTRLFPELKNLPPTGLPGDRRRVVRDVFEDAYNYMKSGQLMRQVVNRINAVDFNNLAERQHFGDIYEQILNDLQSAGNAGEYYTPRAVTAFMVDRIDPHPGEILFDPACGTGGFLTCSLRHMRERYVKRPADEATMQRALRAVEKKPLPHMLCVTNMLLHGVEDPGFVRHDNTLARPYISYTQSDRVDIVLTNPPFGGREEDGIETNFPVHFRTRETADLFLALIIRLLKPGGRAAVVLPDGSLFGEGVKTRLKEHLMEECNLHTIVRLPNSVFRPYASIGTNLLFFEKGTPTTETWFWEHRVPEGQKAYSMTRPIRIEHLADCAAWWGGPTRVGRVEGPQAWRVDMRGIINGARAKAKPLWDEAEREALREGELRGKANTAAIEMRALEDAGTSRADSRAISALHKKIMAWREEAGRAGVASRQARSAGDAIYSAAFNLDIKNPHTVADDHGDPETLLAALDAAEAEAARLRAELKAILEEALLR